MDWFSELKKYRDTVKVNPRENFLTAVFAGLLKIDAVFRRECLSLLFPRIPNLNMTVEIQKRLTPNSQPDIKIVGKDDNHETQFIGLIECKVGAPPDDSQLKKYKDNLGQQYKHVQTDLVYLGQQPKPKFKTIQDDKVFSWAQIYQLVKSISVKEYKELRNEFIKYLIAEAIIMEKGIPNNFPQIIKAYFETINIIPQMLRMVVDRLISKDFVQGKADLDYGKQKSWGKFITLKSNKGIDFRLWFVYWSNPGLTVPLGIVIEMLNENDREIFYNKNIVLENGMKLSFTEFNQSWEINNFGCTIILNEKNAPDLWLLEVEEQINYLYKLVIEILEISGIIQYPL